MILVTGITVVIVFTATAAKCTDVDDITHVDVEDLTIEETLTGWLIRWRKPIKYEACVVTYKVFLNNEKITDAHDDISIEIGNDKTKQCVDNKVIVVPVIKSMEGAATKTTFIGKVGDISTIAIVSIVNEISIDHWTLRWKRPNGFDECTIVYKITLNKNPFSKIIETELIQFTNADLEKCAENTVRITPMIQGLYGMDIKLGIGMPVFPSIGVQELDKEPFSDGWIIKWQRPKSVVINDCIIVYRVTVNDELFEETHEMESIKISNNNLHKCENTVKIMPIVQGNDGMEKEIVVTVDVGDVNNVEVGEFVQQENEDSWTISWSKPKDYEACRIGYKVSLNGESIEEHHNNINIEIRNGQTKPCIDNEVVVSPVIESQEGAAKQTTFIGNPASVGYVRNGKIELEADSMIALTWDKPEGLGLCSFSYNVQLFKDGVELNDIDTTMVEEWKERFNEIENCDDLTASVKAIRTMKEGLSTSVNECDNNRQ